MSIKDLFTKSNKILPAESSETLAGEIESSDLIKEKAKSFDRFEPHVDYLTSSNFAFYGSAEKYYKDAFEQIYDFWPYDGSDAEQTEFLNKSSDLVREMYKTRYPRTNGHIIFSADSWGTPATKVGSYGAPNAAGDYEYIKILGGPHTASNGMKGVPLSETFDGSNIYDTDIYGTAGVLSGSRKGSRLSNLRFNPADGTTVEFWLKKGAFNTTNTEKEVIFDLWNGEGVSEDTYGRFTIELSGTTADESPFRITYRSGSYGISNVKIGTSINTGSVADGTWNHYAVSVHSASAGVKTQLYVNGDLNQATTYTGNSYNMNEVTGSLIGFIGALQTTVSGASGTGVGWAKLSGSLDEFRYWKVRRSSKDIGRNWFTQVRGGTNTDIANASLGVYYKFNEGITGTSSVDSVVVDYSGRISNGKWVGYTSNSRSTVSAISASSAASSEFKDPIIYSFHPEVKSTKKGLMQSGSLHDMGNNSTLFYSIPAWITEEDEEYGDGTLSNLTQMIGSYFDQMQLLIKSIPGLKDPKYFTSGSKPYPFASHLLQHAGLLTPELFVDATIIERIASRDEDRNYNDDISNVKNLIYHNLYNNIINIYKSKGTEKSLRNVLRCFGIGDDIIRFNLYSDRETYKLQRRFRTTTVKKKYVDFSDPDRFESTVYQYADPNNSNTVSFIQGSDSNGYEDFAGMTTQAEIFFPKILPKSNPSYFEFPYITSSLFGMHTAKEGDSTSTAWPTNDYSNFQVFAVRPFTNSKSVYFKLTSSQSPYPLPELTSSIFNEVYDNEKWNLAVRIKPARVGDRLSGSLNTTYTVDFYGVQMRGDTIEDEFHVSGSATAANGKNFLRSAKRIYCGARRTDFTGSTVNRSDVRASSVRYWSKYIPTGDIRDHARDPLNSGISRPYESAFLHETDLEHTRVPNIETLVLNWDFTNVTGSSNDASEPSVKDSIFYVDDISSGSSDSTGRYGWFGELSKNQHSGKGDFFLPANTDDDSAIKIQYLNSYRQQLPETVASSDMVNILSQDDKIFARDHEITKNFFSIEKSMYQTISDEMIAMFSSIVDFNNLIGEPVNQFRQEYKDMAKLRQLFFERVANTPDLDKYIEFYKWLDSSINIIIQQLLPASAMVSEDIRDMVESHVLERNKYRGKFPTIEFKVDDPEAGVKGIEEMVYNWKFGHAPVPSRQSDNAKWWKTRAERNDSPLSVDASVDSDRNAIRKISITHREPSSIQLSKTDGTLYSGSLHALRRFTKIHRTKLEMSPVLRGGTNFHPNKNINYVHSAVHPGGPIQTSHPAVPSGSVMIPLNVMVVDRTTEQDINLKDVNDVNDPNKLKRVSTRVIVGREYEQGMGYKNGSGHHFLPFNLISSSVNEGYNRHVIEGFSTGTLITNLHNDVYGHDKEKPMQGPFTETWVGGHQSRHIDLNRGSDDNKNRPEAWKLLIKNAAEFPPTSSGTFGIVGADYPHPETNDDPGPYYPANFYEKATWTRDGLTKRPVNIANIQYDTSSVKLGNYRKKYEVLVLNGRKENNLFFRKNSGITLPTRISSTDNLKATTHVNSLIGVNPDANSPGNLVVGPFAATSRGSRFVVEGDDVTQFTLPERGTLTASNTSVISSRFSAPGGFEVLSRGYLDVASEEYSPYNAMSFRNLSVLGSSSGEPNYLRMNDHIGKRDGLHSHLRRHSGRHGADSVYGIISASNYETLPAYHKVFRNKLNVLKYSDGGSTIITASSYDNWYVQRTIPRSDMNYSWITASAAGETQRMVGGYAPADGVYSGSDGYGSAIVFTSASFAGSYVLGGERKFPRDKNNSGRPQFMPTDFVGLNYHVSETFNTSTNTLGTTEILDTPNDGFIKTVPSDETASLFNALILNRGSVYGYPSWRQVRHSYHPIIRNERKNNRLSFVQEYNPPILIQRSNGDTEYITPRYGSLSVYERIMPIVSRYNPLQQSVQISLVPGDDDRAAVVLPPQIITLQSSYGNDLVAFDNEDLDNILDTEIDRSNLPYVKIKDLYANGGTEDPTSPIEDVVSVLYNETLYPSAVNMYTTRVRERASYSNGFWRSKLDDRITLGTGDDIKNSSGFEVTASSWPLDPKYDFTTATTALVKASTTKAGELQNNYTHIHNSTILNVTASALYARKHTLGAYNSVVHPAGIPVPQTESAESTANASNYFGGLIDLYRGEAAWDAPSTAGVLKEVLANNKDASTEFETYKLEPWYDSYSDFNQELRLKNKDYSVIPEFRISEHIERLYKTNNINIDLTKLFEIPHADVDSSVPQNSSQDEFYTIFSNSDFMRHFDVIREDHKDIFDASSISLTCKVLKKFNPYKGFYPAQRTLDLATRLSQSYGKHVRGVAGTHNNLSNVHYRPFVTPLFAPGIMFNTIKSGIAVDYPMMLTGSKVRAVNVNNASSDIDGYWGLQSPVLTVGTGTPGSQNYYTKLETALRSVDATLAGLATASNSPPTERWDYRIPFEAIVEPEKYLKTIPLFDYESAPKAKLNVTSSWSGEGDGLYKLMASNFLAEVPEFFLKESSFTSLQSSAIPSTGIEFKSGSVYGARIKLRRTMNQARDWSSDMGTASVAGFNHLKWTKDGSFELPQDPKHQVGLKETFTMYSRTTAFGPPVLGRTAGGTATLWEKTKDATTGGALDSIDGYNWSFTPPYYHGEAWFDIVFEPNRDAKYTVEQFFEASRTIAWRVDAGIEDPRPETRFWTTGSATPLTGSPQPQLVPNYNLSRFSLASFYSGRNINVNAMQLDSSFNIFGLKKINELGGSNEKRADYWIIEPKFETPMLNFGPDSIRGVSETDGTLTIPLIGSESVPRGMWHQFGQLPTGEEGVYIEIDDIPNVWLKEHPAIQYDERYGKKDVVELHKVFQGDAVARVNRLNLHERMESLVDKFGFNPSQKSKRLGEIADSKVIKEAIVAVPFKQVGEGRKFFAIDRNMIEVALERETRRKADRSDEPGESVLTMVETMQNYIFPPKMNFIDNLDLDPFVMYIFEFEYKLTKQDLANIWQNLPPVTYKSFEQEEKTISHSLSANELMGYANLGKEGVPFQENTQWMVFKVKQKARTNYFDKVNTTRSGTELKVLAQNPSATLQDVQGNVTQNVKVGNESVLNYSYNWPYDFVSTIEMCKIGCSIEFSETEEAQVTGGDDLSLSRRTANQPPTGRAAGGSSQTTQKEATNRTDNQSRNLGQSGRGSGGRGGGRR